MATTERDVLEQKVLPELQAIASSMGVQGYQRLRKADLIGAIIAKAQGVDFTPAPRPSSGARGNSAAEPTLLDAAGGEAPAGDAQGDAEDGGRRRRRRRGRGEEGDGAPVGELTAPPAPAAIEGGSNGSAPQAGGAQEGASGEAVRPADAAGEQQRGPAQQADAGQVRQDQAATPAAGERRDDGQAPAQAEQPSAAQAQQSSGSQAQQPAAGQGEQRPDGGQRSGGQGEQRSDGGQGDGQQSRGDGSARQNWNQGNQGNQGGGGGRWDSGQQSGGGRRRNRNRNRRNRFQPGEGGVGVMERGDARGGQQQQDDRPEVTRTGTLDIRSQDGYGFLRVGAFTPGSDDVYVPLSMIRRLGLRRGDEVEGVVKLPRDSEKYAALARVEKINGNDPEEARGRREFKDLTPLYPQERLRLEHNPTEISTRIMDLMCPIGKGQRGLIVSPPKAGKTTLMKQIANAISENNPEVYLIILLTDERPEEVTDMQRSTKAHVIYSTFDRPSEEHCQVSELTIERAKRLVEYGRDVVVLLDGITRLSRAYNLATPASGKILSGGVDSSALYPPKRFFGAARNLEEGGSLTILATALVDTGSRMDEVIFEEFKGTGTMEVRLDRKLSERRIFPALDVDASSTRKEELLLSEEELVVSWKLRRVLGALDPAQALELVVDRMRQSKTNQEFLRAIQRANIS
jgi:transcription termination factor Rho